MNLYDDSWMDELAIKARVDKVLRDDMPREYEHEMYELQRQHNQLNAMVRGQQKEIETLKTQREALLKALRACQRCGEDTGIFRVCPEAERLTIEAIVMVIEGADYD